MNGERKENQIIAHWATSVETIEEMEYDEHHFNNNNNTGISMKIVINEIRFD